MSQRKLLLADDSITIQKVVNLTFADEGIEVVTVGDGDSAMEKMSDFKPDLIMADVNMPGLNGYQICEKIKQSDEFGNIPVILLVGSFEPFDESEAQRVGADDFLTKPFQSIRQLVSKVTELLDADGRNSSATADKSADQNEISQDNAQSFDAPKFADDEADDEMMQTLPGGFALDETAKFETKESFELPENQSEIQSLSSAQNDQSVSFANQNEMNQTETADSPSENYSAERSEPETNDREEKFDAQSAQKSEFADLDFDDDFLLELPPDEDEEFDEEVETREENAPAFAAEENQQTENSRDLSDADETESDVPETVEFQPVENSDNQHEEDNSSVVVAPKQIEPEGVSSETVENLDENQPNAASFVASSQLSPETIDIIVQKVVERLSDKAIREIAWEVVPQVTDEIVKKMAEEKLRES